MIFCESVTLRRCDSVSVDWATIWSSDSFRWPVVSQIQPQIWMARPFPFFFSSCWSFFNHCRWGPSFTLMMHSSWGIRTCYFSPGRRVGGIGSRVESSYWDMSLGDQDEHTVKIPKVTAPAHCLYIFISARNFVRASTMSGHSCPSWYTPFFTSLHVYPNFLSQLIAVCLVMVLFFPVMFKVGRITSLTWWHSSWGVIEPRFWAARYLCTAWSTFSLSSKIYWPWHALALDGGSQWCWTR